MLISRFQSQPAISQVEGSVHPILQSGCELISRFQSQTATSQAEGKVNVKPLLIPVVHFKIRVTPPGSGIRDG